MCWLMSNLGYVAFWKSLFKRCVFFWRTYFSNLSLSYDRLCNPLTCHFRVFGTTFFVAHKQAKFLQSKLADVIREFDFSEHQFLSFERHSQSDKHARALEFFLQRYPPPPLISTWIFGFYETRGFGFLTL